MANDNKMSVDVIINDDGQKQIDKYTHSFDSFRNSVNNLSQPLNSFSNNLNALDKNLSKYTDSLSKLNSQNKEATTIGEDIDEKFTKTLNVFSTGIGILKAFKIELKALAVSLTGALLLLPLSFPKY
ncbi:hypothetical protein GWR56_11180 [Mucilaginibacter sp. 14171R-50]|uniref:hypothetical protein n=1 Tax=Mucilaginibacter sp. 14171R-50 TaxID=2703789 RepID=UPI00138D300B|nr:hypothetical protein [Mucilaginibacter sp. 14171R-50]QHS56068.1 hypothetical protein GWR56_11180 [Mucilaginibacter sp. 14171R-50]